MKINWKIRFSKKNLAFWGRFIFALILPILAYMGYKFEDITTWGIAWDVVMQFVSNPFLVFLTLANAFNIVPDSTTVGLSDSDRALRYREPGKGDRYIV